MKHAVSWAVLVIVAISGSAALGATPPTMSTMGTISAIAGNVITVMTPSGGQVQVRTSTDTRMIGGRAATLREGVEQARALLAGGAAARKLAELRRYR